MSYDVNLAKKLKDIAKNKSQVEIIIGKVMSTNPVQISIYNGLAKLDSSHLYLANGNEQFNYLSGDEVLLLSPNGQMFFIVNKAIKL